MCVIITLIMFGFAIQNLLAKNWLTGLTQLLIALGFLLLLIHNVRKTYCERKGKCYNGCSLTNWITKFKKEK